MNQVQQVVWRLLTDEDFRQLAFTNTSAALGQFQFSATEQSSLYRLCLRLRADDGPLARQFGLARYWSPW